MPEEYYFYKKNETAPFRKTELNTIIKNIYKHTIYISEYNSYDFSLNQKDRDLPYSQLDKLNILSINEFGYLVYSIMNYTRSEGQGRGFLYFYDGSIIYENTLTPLLEKIIIPYLDRLILFNLSCNKQKENNITLYLKNIKNYINNNKLANVSDFKNDTTFSDFRQRLKQLNKQKNKNTFIKYTKIWDNVVDQLYKFYEKYNEYMELEVPEINNTKVTDVLNLLLPSNKEKVQTFLNEYDLLYNELVKEYNFEIDKYKNKFNNSYKAVTELQNDLSNLLKTNSLKKKLQSYTDKKDDIEKRFKTYREYYSLDKLLPNCINNAVELFNYKFNNNEYIPDSRYSFSSYNFINSLPSDFSSTYSILRRINDVVTKFINSNNFGISKINKELDNIGYYNISDLFSEIRNKDWIIKYLSNGSLSKDNFVSDNEITKYNDIYKSIKDYFYGYSTESKETARKKILELKNGGDIIKKINSKCKLYIIIIIFLLILAISISVLYIIDKISNLITIPVGVLSLFGIALCSFMLNEHKCLKQKLE